MLIDSILHSVFCAGTRVPVVENPALREAMKQPWSENGATGSVISIMKIAVSSKSTTFIGDSPITLSHLASQCLQLIVSNASDGDLVESVERVIQPQIGLDRG